jgi:hypothetical protein
VAHLRRLAAFPLGLLLVAWCTAAFASPVPVSRTSPPFPLTQIAACAPARIDARPLPGGLMQVNILSECRRQQAVRILYAGIELVRRFDAQGRLNTQIDCIAGDEFPADLFFEDGTTASLSVSALDLARVTKVAVLWKAPVNLDLHAFEYAAKPDSPGHVWQGSSSSAAEAQRRTEETGRGRGFLSSSSTGAEIGTKIEVYTFWRHPEQKSGVVSMAIDYETRAREPRDPDTCGTGLYSEVKYETLLFDRKGSIKRQFGSFSPVDCNVQLSGMARFNNKTVPEITAKP